MHKIVCLIPRIPVAVAEAEAEAEVLVELVWVAVLDVTEEVMLLLALDADELTEAVLLLAAAELDVDWVLEEAAAELVEDAALELVVPEDETEELVSDEEETLEIAVELYDEDEMVELIWLNREVVCVELSELVEVLEAAANEPEVVGETVTKTVTGSVMIDVTVEAARVMTDADAVHCAVATAVERETPSLTAASLACFCNSEMMLLRKS